MIRLSSKGWIINVAPDSGYDGTIKHKDDDKVNLFLLIGRDEMSEQFNLPYMAFQHLDRNKATELVDNTIEKTPENLKPLVIQMREQLIDYKLKNPVIFVDHDSLEKLKNNDKYAKCVLLHELGHFVHSDETYHETQQERTNAVLEGRVIQSETDADDYAFSAFEDDYYDAMVSRKELCVERMKETNDERFFGIVHELDLRIERLADKLLNR